MKVVSLKMLKYYKGVNPGVIAGYPENIADRLKEMKMAEDNVEGEEVEEEDGPSEPEAKVMMNLEELMVGSLKNIKKELDTKVSSGNYLYGVQHLSDMQDYESLNKGRGNVMEFLKTVMEERDVE